MLLFAYMVAAVAAAAGINKSPTQLIIDTDMSGPFIFLFFFWEYQYKYQTLVRQATVTT